jgi:hypothetical protein
VKVTVAPDTEHGPVAVNVTVKLDDAVAVRTKGPGMVLSVMLAKVIVCEALEIETVLVADPIA